MGARHARTDDDAEAAPASVLHLVDDASDDRFSPEVRAVLDAVAMVHSAVISWAVATTVDAGPRHTEAPAGRHRR